LRLSTGFNFISGEALHFLNHCRPVRRMHAAEALAEAEALLPSLQLWQPKSEGGLPKIASLVFERHVHICRFTFHVPPVTHHQPLTFPATIAELDVFISTLANYHIS
jgi:hypothetical protein